MNRRCAARAATVVKTHQRAGDQDGPTSGCAGLTLYTIIRELQRLLATWTGACITCHQPVKPLHRNKRHRT